MESYEEHPQQGKKTGKQHNVLPLWGNESTMNLNPLILANIQGSSYFKVHLFKLKTYHEVVDEIYYQVKHLEPWERGSRKTSGQTGMCGGVRGVGAGGIVSTAFCLLYKLYTLRLTRKQVNGLLTHTDSPYIRALGFMYIRYTQPPADLYDWYEDYLLDEEEIDVRAGGGQVITIGQVCHQYLTKLDWFSTLFPRIPVPIQKQIEQKLNNYARENNINFHQLHQQNNVVGHQRPASYSETSTAPSKDAQHGRSGGSIGIAAATTSSEFSAEYRDRDRDYKEDRRRRDDRSVAAQDRDYYAHREFRREDRYEEVPSRSKERRSPNVRQHQHREKHKKKHKNKDKHRSRSRSRDRKEKNFEHYREKSYEKHREKLDKDKRY